MPLWIALHVPDLPLQAAGRGLLPEVPFAVYEGPDERPVILAANATAQVAGIAPGMTLSAARAREADLTACRREAAREQAALRRVGRAALNFSSQVALAESAVLLEVKASLKLFRGLKALALGLEAEIARTGLRVVAACAPVPLAAWLLARARAEDARVRHAGHPHELARTLAPVPIRLTGWPGEVVEALDGLGIRRLGSLERLPRDGLARRFGPAVVHDIERMLGERADPRTPLAVPERFASRLEFVRETDDAGQLQQAAECLFAEAELFLRARAQATLQLRLKLEHGYRRSTPMTLGTREAACDAHRWGRLFREQLARQPLAETVCALRLDIPAMQAHRPGNTSFLPDAGTRALAADRLVEQLLARMGPGAVVTVEAADDHRPEKAVREAEPQRIEERVEEKRAPYRVATHARARCDRPTWLLRRPRSLLLHADQPVHRGPLRFLAGPERIETGWWDGAPARRDYYVAANREGETLWVYRDLARGGWYLHGYFA